MLRFLVILTLASPIAPYSGYRSAATPGQIKFAIENQYDQTGPGAKGPETAYKTYKHLEEALIGYLNDKDTKLPEREKAKALYLLYLKSHKPIAVTGKLFSDAANPSEENNIEPTFKPSILSNDWRLQGVRGNVVLKDHSRWQKVLLTKSNPRSVSHYTREPEVDVELADFVEPKYRASHAYQPEDSSPQVFTQTVKSVILQGPQSYTHTFKGATHTHEGGAHNFQGSADTSNALTYQGPTHAPSEHSKKGATHVTNAQSFLGSSRGQNPGQAQAQAATAQSFYSFVDGEGHHHVIQYRTDHRQTARYE